MGENVLVVSAYYQVSACGVSLQQHGVWCVVRGAASPRASVTVARSLQPSVPAGGARSACAGSYGAPV